MLYHCTFRFQFLVSRGTSAKGQTRLQEMADGLLRYNDARVFESLWRRACISLYKLYV
jgi:hypothetical protein